MCLLLGACCKGMTSHPSSVDENGNVYNQYGDKLGHYSKKPKFFDSAGNVYDKHYICVHDTGDHYFGAKMWSDIVKNANLGKRVYPSSFQYVVGNDGYYHNIPDNEIAYHAGDIMMTQFLV